MKISPKRGEVWWYDPLGSGEGSIQGGRRPALIVQNDTGNKYSSVYTIVPLTTELKKNLPTQVMFLIINGGRKIVNTALAEQVTTVPGTRLENYECTIEKWIMGRVDEALSIHLGLKDIPSWKTAPRDYAPYIVRQEACTSEDSVGIVPMGSSPTNDGEVKLEAKKKGFWTRTRKLEFIDDKDALPIEVVRRKYGLGKESTVMAYYYKFKKET